MEKPKGIKSLRAKLMILTIIPAVLVMSVLGHIISDKVNEMRKQVETTMLEKSAETVNITVQGALASLNDAAVSQNRSMTLRNYFETLDKRSEMMLNSYYSDVKQELELIVSGCDMARSAWIVDYDTNVAFHNPSHWWRSGDNWRLDQRPYYLRLSTGWRTILTEPYQGEGSSGTTISAISPVTDKDGSVIGVVGVDMDLNKLATVLHNAGKSHSGTALLITADGYVIEYTDGKGTIKKTSVAELEYGLVNAISLQNQGIYSFTRNDIDMIGRLELVDNTDDWMLLFMMPESVITGAGSTDMMSVMLSFLCFNLGLTLVYLIWIRRLTRRTRLARESAERVFAGETDVTFPALTSDETGLMGRAANVIVDKLNTVSYAADRYTALILPAAQKSVASVKQLASNTADNAYSVMDIADSLRSISYNLSANAKGASHTGERAQSVMKELNDNGKRLNSMLTVAHQTKSAISEIKKSVKLIEEIAFQTHILSLSANVEASAMEDADSSSFKVIAEEVRELARQSTGSASRTKELIIKASELAQQCVDLSEEAARSLMIATDESNNIMESIEQISRLSKEDARALSDLMASADHLSGKVNDNSNVALVSSELMDGIVKNAVELREVLESVKEATRNEDD